LNFYITTFLLFFPFFICGIVCQFIVSFIVCTLHSPVLEIYFTKKILKKIGGPKLVCLDFTTYRRIPDCTLLHRQKDVKSYVRSGLYGVSSHVPARQTGGTGVSHVQVDNMSPSTGEPLVSVNLYYQYLCLVCIYQVQEAGSPPGGLWIAGCQ